jgi:hypothetical protein
MSQAIFVSKGGEGFVKREPFEVESEERLRQLLEKLIEENVDIILPTPKGREPFKLVFLTREFGFHLARSTCSAWMMKATSTSSRPSSIGAPRGGGPWLRP